MGTLIAAYLIAWLGVVWYVLRLGAGQCRLQRALEALQRQGNQLETRDQTAAKAA